MMTCSQGAYPRIPARVISLKETLIKPEWNFSNDRIAQFLLENGANRHSIREIFKQKMGDSSFEKTAHDFIQSPLNYQLPYQATSSIPVPTLRAFAFTDKSKPDTFAATTPMAF